MLPEYERALFRAVAIDAPSPVVFRWLCQLKLAPYSYDLLDNLGRRSPQHLVDGVDRLTVGERVMVFELVSFARDEHLTLWAGDHVLFGDVAISYTVVADGPTGTRLVVKLVTNSPRGLLGLVMRRLLPAGDLVMMRRQLLNFKALAEASVRSDPGLSPSDPVSATVRSR